MMTRVYVILDVIDGKPDQVVRSLRNKSGVVMADVLEDSSNVITVVEASERQRLAELTVRALASVESMAECLEIMPARDRHCASSFTKPLRPTKTGNRGKSTAVKKKA